MKVITGILAAAFVAMPLFCEATDLSEDEKKLIVCMIKSNENLEQAKELASSDDCEDWDGFATYDENWQYVFTRQRDMAALISISDTNSVRVANFKKYIKYYTEDLETQSKIWKQFDRLRERLVDAKNRKDRERAYKRFVLDVQKAGVKAAKKWREWKINIRHPGETEDDARKRCEKRINEMLDKCDKYKKGE